MDTSVEGLMLIGLEKNGSKEKMEKKRVRGKLIGSSPRQPMDKHDHPGHPVSRDTTFRSSVIQSISMSLDAHVS